MEGRRLRAFLDDANFAEGERVALPQLARRRYRIRVREDLAPPRSDRRLAGREELGVANPEMGLRDRGDTRGRQRGEEPAGDEVVHPGSESRASLRGRGGRVERRMIRRLYRTATHRQLRASEQPLRIGRIRRLCHSSEDLVEGRGRWIDRVVGPGVTDFS